ncbi:MAG: PHP domain-containing protein [Mycobacteriales bacterium]
MHAHSTASDGTDSPAQVVAAAAAAGLATIALTDHDTTGGWAEATRALESLPPGLTLVLGAELSCVSRSCFPPAALAPIPAPGDSGSPPEPISLHLLAYLFDPAEPALRAARARLRDGRLHRAERMVAKLADDGFPISWPTVREAAAGGAVGRPHIARALVAAGVVPTVAAAFSPELIGTGGRYYVDKEELAVLEALRLVRAAGGVSVFAHPGASRRGPVVSEETIGAMAAEGLAGLEVDHADHDPRQRAELRTLARDLGLFVTGGSDYHGSSKTARIGDETTAPEVVDAIIATATGTAPRVA